MMKDPERVASYIRERVVTAGWRPRRGERVQVLEIGTNFFTDNETDDGTVFAPTTVEQHAYAMNWLKANIKHEDKPWLCYRIPSPWRDNDTALQCFMVALVLTEALDDLLTGGSDEPCSLSEDSTPSTLSSMVEANRKARVDRPGIVEATMESVRATLIRLAPDGAPALSGEFEGDVTLSPEWVARAIMPFV